MPDKLPPDRFDDVRREWIAFRQGDSLIQRRRAEQIGRIVRKRQRIKALAVPDPHDDTVLPWILWRQTKSRFSKFEVFLVVVVGALIPVGWPVGWLLKSAISALIPDTLRGYPIAALVWSGTGLGVLTVLVYAIAYDPAGSFGQIAVLPWVSLQLSAIPVVAGVYGILEGWLAIDGSDQWWPLTPVKQPLSAEDAARIFGAYDLTGASVVDVRPLNEPGPRTRP
jgi:hypothetical protein